MKSTKLIVFAFMVFVGCKDEVTPVVAKHKCHAVPLIIDTVLLEPEPLNSLYEKGNSGEVWEDEYGCATYQKLTRNIYFNPIINHSKI